MNQESNEEWLSIGEASKQINLPESTIRYYDKEFSDFLSIPRGKNNQRLFAEHHLKDLEYIRYLIKREELSIQEVRDRLDREEDYSREERAHPTSNAQSQAMDEGKPQSGPSTIEGSQESHAEPGASGASGSEETLSRLAEELEQLNDRLSTLEDNQEKILELLDLNLQRYNKLVEDL